MITNQAYLFLVFTINGILIGLLFDIFRILRRSFKTSDIITYIQDILFWILTGFLLLYSIFTFSNGEVRFYMFLGIFLGCLLYMITFSHYFIKINVKILTIIKKIIKILVFPIKGIINSIKKLTFKPISFVTINISNTKKNLQKNINFLKNKKDFWKKSRKI